MKFGLGSIYNWQGQKSPKQEWVFLNAYLLLGTTQFQLGNFNTWAETDTLATKKHALILIWFITIPKYENNMTKRPNANGNFLIG